MNKQECIKQIEDLKKHCQYQSIDNDPIWNDDVQALDMAIKELKRTAPEVPVQEQCDKFYIINVLINNRSYYLFDLELSISKNISDSLIISSENFAFKLATVAENFYEKSLVKVKNVSLEEIFY